MNQKNQPNQDAIPSYFHLDPHKREELLSQIGSFTQIQYQIFHNICDFWEPALEYNTYILKTKRAALVGLNQLELLMNKMQDAHMGLLQYKLTEDGLKPFRIVLTDKDTIHFYYYVCEEIVYRNIHENGHPFVTLKAFDMLGLPLPGENITPLDPKVLSPGFHKKMIPQRRIFGITRRNRSPLLIPSGMLDEFISYLIGNLIRETQSMTLLENISRISGIKISELQKNMNARDPSFWITLSKSLMEHKDDLKLRIKGLSPLIFTSVQLLYAYFSNSLSELKEKQQEKTERLKAQKEIVTEIREKGPHWSSATSFDALLKEREKAWKGFREEFKEAVLKRKEGGDQPDLILLAGQIIHKDFLFPFFKGELEYIGRDLQGLYQDMMADLLKNGQADKYTQFYSRNNFRADILNRIRNKSPQLKELLQKPLLMAGTGFYYYREVKGIKRNDTIRDSLELYFKNDLKQFQNIDDILKLNLMALFDKSFSELGWWSKFIIRITGKYDSYTTTFSSPSPHRTSPKKNHPSRNSIEPASSTIIRSSSRRRSPAPPYQKMHSTRQKRKAWADFSDAVNKKK